MRIIHLYVKIYIYIHTCAGVQQTPRSTIEVAAMFMVVFAHRDMYLRYCYCCKFSRDEFICEPGRSIASSSFLVAAKGLRFLRVLRYDKHLAVQTQEGTIKTQQVELLCGLEPMDEFVFLGKLTWDPCGPSTCRKDSRGLL